MLTHHTTTQEDKAITDLIPVVESVVESLMAVKEVLEEIDSILNPRPGSVDDMKKGGGGGKKR